MYASIYDSLIARLRDALDLDMFTCSYHRRFLVLNRIWCMSYVASWWSYAVIISWRRSSVRYPLECARHEFPPSPHGGDVVAAGGDRHLAYRLQFINTSAA